MYRYKTTFISSLIMITIAVAHSARADEVRTSVDAGTAPADGAISVPDAGADGVWLPPDGLDPDAHAVQPASDDADGAASASSDADGAASTSMDAVPPTNPEGAAYPDTQRRIDRRTGIVGRIGDRKTGLPLEKAPVNARGEDGRQYSTETDAAGSYQLFVPPGSYTVRSHYDMYQGVRMDKVPVTRGHLAKSNLVLDPIDFEEEVVVQEVEIPYRADTTTAAAQDELRKESRGISEGMGSQQMSQQGAGDAGSAARRVVGVTLSGNQLVVRGLAGRYVKVVLNGLPIPTTDPDFPSVDLDLFPTSVIDSLNIQKVFLPDIPGDFAGGMLDLNTVSFPRKFLLPQGRRCRWRAIRERLEHSSHHQPAPCRTEFRSWGLHQAGQPPPRGLPGQHRLRLQRRTSAWGQPAQAWHLGNRGRHRDQSLRFAGGLRGRAADRHWHGQPRLGKRSFADRPVHVQPEHGRPSSLSQRHQRGGVKQRPV
jgi:hypothetical protein